MSTIFRASEPLPESFFTLCIRKIENEAHLKCLGTIAFPWEEQPLGVIPLRKHVLHWMVFVDPLRQILVNLSLWENYDEWSDVWRWSQYWKVGIHGIVPWHHVADSERSANWREWSYLNLRSETSASWERMITLPGLGNRSPIKPHQGELGDLQVLRGEYSISDRDDTVDDADVFATRMARGITKALSASNLVKCAVGGKFEHVEYLLPSGNEFYYYPQIMDSLWERYPREQLLSFCHDKETCGGQYDSYAKRHSTKEIERFMENSRKLTEARRKRR